MTTSSMRLDETSYHSFVLCDIAIAADLNGSECAIFLLVMHLFSSLIDTSSDGMSYFVIVQLPGFDGSRILNNKCNCIGSPWIPSVTHCHFRGGRRRG